MSDVVYGGTVKKDRKARNKANLLKNLREFKNVMVIGVDNVGSKQMQETRIALRGEAVIVMGKNTLMRKVIREEADASGKDSLNDLADLIVQNIGLVFTNGDLAAIRTKLLENKVPAAAKAGVIAPLPVIIPAGSTGLDPGQTGFFQVLNIGTKIARGAIEIVSDVVLISKGDKVGASQVALLSKLNIKPFFYGFTCLQVYEDGFIYAGEVLALSSDDICQKFLGGARYVAALSIATGIPTLASVGHSLRTAFRNLVAITVTTDYSFTLAEEYMAGAGSAAAAPVAETKAPEPEPESESESESGDMDDFF